MRKTSISIDRLKLKRLSKASLSRIKGGGNPENEINKLLKKFDEQKKKGDFNKLDKTMDKLSCLGYTFDDCCGNGNGSW